jgi:hypothetical protein
MYLFTTVWNVKSTRVNKKSNFMRITLNSLVALSKKCSNQSSFRTSTVEKLKPNIIKIVVNRLVSILKLIIKLLIVPLISLSQV